MASPAPVVDSHFHIWELERFSYQFPTRDMGGLYRNFTIEQYEDAMHTTPVKHGVFVQVMTEAPAETDWILELAEQHRKCIKGIVAWYDVTSPELGSFLSTYRTRGPVVGIRTVMPRFDETWLSRAEVLSGLKTLEDMGMTCDLLIWPNLLKSAIKAVRQFPRLKFVVNHLAKPQIPQHVMDGWKDSMAELATFPNVYCKISGMLHEAQPIDWKWSIEELEPYVKHVLDHFGVDRCMFGSDWPIPPGIGIATYREIYELTQSLLAHLSQDARDKIFGLNAVKCYGLEI